MRMVLHDFVLPLAQPFTISRHTQTDQPSLVVELIDGEHHGFGEATTNPYYHVTFETLHAALEHVREFVEAHDLTDPAAFWQALHPALDESPFAHCALDQAAWDLWGKKLGKPVYELWGLSTEKTPLSNFTIGIDTIDMMVAKMNELPGWPIYKIKLGTDHDIDIVAALRKHTDAVLRVDANCGWTAEQTIENSRALADLGVEFIEQPLPADRWDDMERVHAESVLPVIADESCVNEADVDRCAGHFHGVNIKLVKCGGLTPARRMIDRARQLKMEVMVGCMTESTVGISAIAQLLPLLDYVDMDGPLLLSKDIAEGVRIENGRAVFPDRPGTGVRLFI